MKATRGRRPHFAAGVEFSQNDEKAARQAPACTEESLMFLRLALCIGIAAAVTVAGPPPSRAQQPQTTTPAPATKPDAATPAPATPATPAPTPAPGAATATAEPSDPFGEDTTLTGKPMIYTKGSGTWDSAFDTITKAFKKLRGFVDKENLKVDGMPITVFTSTDDTGFSFEAALPLAEAPKNPPRGEIGAGTSPQGHALKFVHRGSYDGLDNTYEAITNFLDEKRLEAKDMFIEQYVTDPLTTSEENLVVNVFVMIK
jgi:effector-binding domain-containing protein